MDSKKRFNQPEELAFGNALYLISLAKETGELNKPYFKNALKVLSAFSYNPWIVNKTLKEVLVRLERKRAQHLLSGNPFPIPYPSVLEGDFYIGQAVGINEAANFNFRETNENIGIWGRAGSGKSNACSILCLGFLNKGIPVRVFDYKDEYRDLLPFIEDGISLNSSFDKLNPLYPDRDPRARIQFLADTLQQEFNLKPETKFMLINYIDELYKNYGVYENSNTYPNMQNLKEFLLEEINKTSTPAAKKRKIYTCLEVIETLLTSLGDMFDCSVGYSEEQLTRFKFISYEMSNLSSNIQAWLSKLRLKDLSSRCLSSDERNILKMVVVFEEAKMLFSKGLNQSTTSVDYIKQMVTQGRSSGFGDIIIDQNKNDLDDFAINNLSVQICFNLSSPRERRLTGYSLGCSDERQIEQLRYLKIPYAVISKAGFPPFLIRIPRSPIRKHISTSELIEIAKLKLTNSSITPSQGPKRPKINFGCPPDYETRQEPKPRTLKDYLQDVKRFLEQVKNNLQLNISNLYKSLKLSGRKGDKLKAQLLENDLLEEEIIRTGERKRPSKTLKLTAKGERIFSWLKQKVKGA